MNQLQRLRVYAIKFRVAVLVNCLLLEFDLASFILE